MIKKELEALGKRKEGEECQKEVEVEWKGDEGEKGDEKWRKEGEGRSKGSAKVEQSGKEVMRKKEGGRVATMRKTRRNEDGNGEGRRKRSEEVVVIDKEGQECSREKILREGVGRRKTWRGRKGPEDEEDAEEWRGKGVGRGKGSARLRRLEIK